MPTNKQNIIQTKEQAWLPSQTRPLVISGPCSAENEEQLIKSCVEAAETGLVHILRAGLWKPRTRPGSFEGVGKKALPWLKKAKEMTGLPVMVEVADEAHIEACLDAGIDYFWIGARSTVNPFIVQRLAEAMQGQDIPVFIKNPVNPDLFLWIGAFERFKNAGINKLAAIHRGFSYFGEKIYRNRPQWQIAIEFKQLMPNVPLFCDPSHICGNRELLQSVAQKALDLNYDGLMIESHCNPSIALSDARQQVTGSKLKELLSNLTLRENFTLLEAVDDEIDKYRSEIDYLDEELLNILASRMRVSKQIGEIKKVKNFTILHEKRWQEVLMKLSEKAKDLDLSEDLIEKVLKAIHDESIEAQEQVMNDPSKNS